MTDKKTLLEFPCEFTIKVFGLNTSEFESTILDIIKKDAPDASHDAMQSRLSENKKYNALSITITAASKEQLDTIYQNLSACKQVLMAL